MLQPNRESLKKIRLPLEPSAKRKKIETGKSKALADAFVEEVDFLCGLVSFNEKERTDMKLENAHMKQDIVDMKQDIADIVQEIADMKQEIADMKQEIADMKQGIADMKQEIADMKQEIADMKQEIADMKQEIADMKLEINILTFGLQRFAGSDDDKGFCTGFPSYSTLISFYEFLPPSATQLNYWGSDNTKN